MNILEMQSGVLGEAAKRGRATWSPDASILAWWYGDIAVSAGNNWIDQIAGYTLPVDSRSVVAGTGLIQNAGENGNSLSDFPAPARTSGTGHTHCFWYKGNNGPFTNYGLLKYTYTFPFSWGPWQTNRCIIYAYGNPQISLEGRVADTWQHFAIVSTVGTEPTYADATAEYFINGTSIGTWTPGTTDSLGTFRIADVGADVTFSLDDIQIYSTALSTDDLADIIANSPGSHA